MKKFYIQKDMFWFLNILSIISFLATLITGLVVENKFYLSIPSLILTPLSFLHLINKIYYDDKQIKVAFVSRKVTINIDDIQEVFVGKARNVTMVVINYDKKVETPCENYWQYAKEVKKAGITRTIVFGGGFKKDLRKFLQCLNCEITGKNPLTK